MLTSGMLATCSSDKTIRLWDIKITFKEKHVLTGHSGYVCALVELPNNILSTGSHDRSIKFWDLNTYKIK